MAGATSGIPSGPRAGREMPPPPSQNYDRRSPYASEQPAQYGSPMRGQAPSRFALKSFVSADV